jgi:hypothetical protein
MSILILALIVLIVAALLIYAVDLVPIAAPFNGLIKLLIILIAVLVILLRAGLI